MVFVRVVLAMSALPAVVVGVTFLVSPMLLGEPAGMSIDNASGDNGIRAIFGGLQLGCGCLIGLSLFRKSWIASGLVLQLAVYDGMVIGRVVSILAVGIPSDFVMALVLGEGLGVIAGVAALYVNRRHEG